MASMRVVAVVSASPAATGPARMMERAAGSLLRGWWSADTAVEPAAQGVAEEGPVTGMREVRVVQPMQRTTPAGLVATVLAALAVLAAVVPLLNQSPEVTAGSAAAVEELLNTAAMAALAVAAVGFASFSRPQRDPAARSAVSRVAQGTASTAARAAAAAAQPPGRRSLW
jgi:hypothetical protein